ncbi:hypothetical protein BST81_22360 [Leptolyngbya sp. 'hensonii']|uniref:hypothetical protein n=1 Tax=Leptolyngbya sp. 'hensonii' TaxID=1922337 RepID=UPI00094F6AE4|nr:hypothetical protein [Leptolyngbya sp. 'hensonii']OLP16149.1 hypothetical protein BST81_22360 [Leptolyngbya sp. 'hensonii']
MTTGQFDAVQVDPQGWAQSDDASELVLSGMGRPLFEQPDLTPSDSLLLNCLQRLEAVESSLQVLMAAAQVQISEQRDLRQNSDALASQLTDLQTAIGHLSQGLSRQSPLSSTDLKPLEDQLVQLGTLICPGPSSLQLLGGGMAVLSAVLVLYTSLVLRPTYLSLSRMLSQQQGAISHLLACTLNPKTTPCKDLRRSIDKQQSPTKPSRLPSPL